MKRHEMVFFLCAFLLALAHQAVHAAPPFSGTPFIGPEIITPADPTAFRSVSFAGRGQRTMFDRRVNDWVNVDRGAEVRVGDRSTADRAPDRREDRLDSPGRKPIWGGNNNLLIHTGQAGIYLADGILEETLVHEAAHTSLDADHASAAGWVAAQSADGDFISTYARDFPRREDMAESFLLYLAVRFRADRISPSLANTILQTIPNRIDYLDSQLFDMYPITPRPTGVQGYVTADFPNGFALGRNYPNPFNAATVIDYRVTEPGQVVLKIANLLGQEITTLVAEEKAAGSHKVVWDGRDRLGRRMASGVYLYRIEAQGNALTSKMLLLQ